MSASRSGLPDSMAASTRLQRGLLVQQLLVFLLGQRLA